MRVRSSVFGSASEREVFRALESRWSPRLALYPSLPLASIIDLEPSDSLPANERRFFYATSVDYTFCEPGGRPLFSIEFDGIGRGFSRQGSYLPKRSTSDANREWKLNFKLRIAKSVGYRLAVVSFEETEVLDGGSSLTILDALVGEFLARRAEWRLAQEMVEERRDFLDSLPPDERHEAIQDIIVDAGVLAELENDPLDAEVSRLEHELDSQNPRVEPFWEPPAPEPDGFPPSPEVLGARIRAIENAERVGCRVIIETPAATIIRVVRVRNVGSDLDLMTERIAENIARYLALKQARALMKQAATTP